MPVNLLMVSMRDMLFRLGTQAHSKGPEHGVAAYA